MTVGEGVEFEVGEGEREKLEGFHRLLLGARWLKKSVEAQFWVMGKEERGEGEKEGKMEIDDEEKEVKGATDGGNTGIREFHYPKGPMWYLVLPLLPPSSPSKPAIDWEMISLLSSFSPSSSSPSSSPDPIQLDQLVRKIYFPLSPSPSPSLPYSSPSSHLQPDETFFFPQIWRPKYNPLKRYIVFGPSSFTAHSPFPNSPSPFVSNDKPSSPSDPSSSPSDPSSSLSRDNSPSYDTFKEYFSVKYNLDCGDGPLYTARPLWDFSGSMSSYLPGAPSACSCSPSPLSPSHSPCCSCTFNFTPPPPPTTDVIHLPPSLCYVDPLPFAYLFFGALFLPQALYYLEHLYRTQLFVDHTRFIFFPLLFRYNFPLLHVNLCPLPRNFSQKMHSVLTSTSIIEVMRALTPQSNIMSPRGAFSYERLEHLGDGVLKLLHTNSLISSEISHLMTYLHEGLSGVYFCFGI